MENSSIARFSFKFRFEKRSIPNWLVRFSFKPTSLDNCVFHFVWEEFFNNWWYLYYLCVIIATRDIEIQILEWRIYSTSLGLHTWTHAGCFKFAFPLKRVWFVVLDLSYIRTMFPNHGWRTPPWVSHCVTIFWKEVTLVCKLSNKNFIGTRKSKFQCRNVIHMKTLGQTRLMSLASQDVADILTNNLDCINLS